MIMPWEWLFLIVLAFLGYKALKARPRLEDALGSCGASVFLYMVIKWLPFQAIKPLELSNEITHTIAGFVAFCCVGGLWMWLRSGTLKADKNHQDWTASYKAGNHVSFQEFMDQRNAKRKK